MEFQTVKLNVEYFCIDDDETVSQLIKAPSMDPSYSIFQSKLSFKEKVLPIKQEKTCKNIIDSN